MTDSNNVIAKLEDTNPRDGWRVKEFESSKDGSISLWLEFILDGEPREEFSTELAKWSDDSHENDGQRRRLKAAAVAIARFANLGGNTDDLHVILGVISQVGLTLDWEGQGWHVMDTQQEPDDVYHYLANAEGQVLVWYEDVYIEMTTLDELHRDLVDENEDLLDSEGAGAEEPYPGLPGS